MSEDKKDLASGFAFPLPVGKVEAVKSSTGETGKVDVKAFFSAFQGKKVTSEQIASNLISEDANLSMITEVRDPVAMSLWDTIGERAEMKHFPKTAATLKGFAKWYRKNMVSFNRQSRKELKEILVADMERSREDDLGGLERGFGGKRGGR